jgi:hypothetical protein
MRRRLTAVLGSLVQAAAGNASVALSWSAPAGSVAVVYDSAGILPAAGFATNGATTRASLTGGRGGLLGRAR